MYTPRVNGKAPLTRLIVGKGLLRATPFHLVDVGASGGIDSYWEVFGDSLRATGFDALLKEVARLNATRGARQRYYACLVGDKSYQAPAGVPNTQPFQRTTAARAAEIQKCNYAATYFDQTGSGLSTSELIELDEFFLHEHPADIDFIKIDTDGSDYQVLRGARRLLSETSVLGVGIESQFHGPVHGESNTFRNIDRLLTGNGFSLFDLEVYRYSRSSLPRPFVYRIPAQTHGGQVLWGEALYLRDAGKRGYENEWHIRLAPEKILKLLCLFEIFGLEDCAAELLLQYRQTLDTMLPVNECLDLLAVAVSGSKTSYAQHTGRFERDPASFYPRPKIEPVGLAARALQTVRRVLRRNTPADRDDALSALDDVALCRTAAGLIYCRPPGPYPGWTFAAGWDSPDPEFRRRQAIWEEFRRRRLERSIPYRWHFGLELQLYMGTDLSRQLFIAGCADPNEFQFLDSFLRPGMVAVDAGANAGLYTLFAANRLGAEGLVLAFEPSAREFQQLEDNVARNRLENVRCLPYALAETDGEAGLRIAGYEHSGLNTLGEFVHEAVGLLCSNSVPLRRLDRVAAETGIGRLDFLKMDVEGAEARLLDGAQTVLEKFRPVLLLEIHDTALRVQGSGADQLRSTLREKNYRLYTFDAASGLPVAEEPGTNVNVIAWPAERPFPDSAARSGRSALAFEDLNRLAEPFSQEADRRPPVQPQPHRQAGQIFPDR